MYCTKCGNELREGIKYCTQCGAAVEPGKPVEATATGQTKSGGKKSKTVKIVLAVMIALIVFALASVFGVFAVKKYISQKQMNTYSEQIRTDNVSPCVDELTAALDDWGKLGFFDIQERADILEIVEKISNDSEKYVKELDEAKKKIAGARDAASQYDLVEASYLTYMAAIDDMEKAVEKRDIDYLHRAINTVDNAFDQLISDNEAYVREQLEQFENMNTSTADQSDMEDYQKAVDVIQNCLDQQKYSDMKDALKTAEDIYLKYVEPENALNIAVRQIDVTGYPKVKLYLDVVDEYGGTVEQLDGGMFYIRKQDANGNYIKQVVSRATQLDEQEGLNIDMVADVSGSMTGEPLYTAQNVMREFVESVQFSAGDMVELTSFSDGVYIEQDFTNNVSLLKDSIDNLDTKDMTALYDALYTAVNKVASKNGAKCVIAFTDGLDTGSDLGPSDVIDLAQRYHVPVFIIGIGDDDFYEARNIANSTGGQYYSVDSIDDMRSIYEEIYREEKKMYMVEFEDSSNVDLFSESEIVAGYHTLQYGGETYFSYTPYTLASVNENQFYTDGPEAVVAAYMKNFASAMTNMDYSYIAPYVLSGSQLETDQRKYVQRGIAETLDSYEIEDVSYNSSDECIVTTRETYFVQKQGDPLNLLTQRCKYVVQKVNGEWKVAGFAESVQVLARIKY